MAQKRVIIGTIIYGAVTAPYLSWFKKSLVEQTYQDFTLLIHDNTTNNFGFSRAYNLLIKQAIKAQAEYFLIINPDLYLEPQALEKLVAALDEDSELAIAVPKLKRWDFTNKNFTNLIDSCGLGLAQGFNFFDYGQGEIDQGQYDKQIIFGAGGAAGLWRLSALKKLEDQGQYFDEHFFMYKEDCDLAYRAFLAGLKVKLIPLAIGWHDRTSAAGNIFKRFFNRFGRSTKIRCWSFINQHWLVIKYWRRQSLFNKFLVLVRLFVMLIEALLFEQYLLSSYKVIFKQAKTLTRY